MAKAKQKVTYEKAWYMVAVARILLGFVFLWGFLDKTMGLGFPTRHDQAWVLGGSPTADFLRGTAIKSQVGGEFLSSLAGQVWVDWLFMLGLLGVGLALMLGIGLRLAAVAGTAMLVILWVAMLMPGRSNPLVDNHLVYIAMLWVFAFSPRKVSMFDQWLETPSIKKTPWLW